MIVDELQAQDISEVSSIFHRILFAVDFSPASHRALYAGMSFAGRDAKVALLHVITADWRYEMLEHPPELSLEEADAKEQLQNWADHFGATRTIEQILVKGEHVAKEIATLADNSKADLLVMGTHGRAGLKKLALGSIAEEVLRIAPCPVITIGPNVKATEPEEHLALHTILFATDFGYGSAKALPLVFDLAKQNSSRLIVLHFLPPMPATSSLSAYAPATAGADELRTWQSTARSRSLRQLKSWLPKVEELQHEPECIVGTEFLPEGLLTAANQHAADLIVMGANRRGSARMAAHIPWTTIHEVVRQAPCPVLTVAE